jgi:hypothetical protein
MANRVRESLEPADERRLPAPEIARPPHVEAVLRMQATAGNRATSRLIARDPAAPEAVPAEKSGGSGYVMTIEGFGQYEVSSFQTTSKNAILVTFDAGKDAARLMQAATEGRPIKSVTIAIRDRTITLLEVVITSVQQAGDPRMDEPLVSVGFDGKSLEVK